MRTVRIGPALGLTGQVVLLSALSSTVGLGVAGWLAGIGYGLILCAVLSRGLDRAGMARLGPANRVTLIRATLVGGVVALTVESFARHAPVEALVALTIVALALDGVDGWVARRTGSFSPLGARFDMEIDAFLLLVLSAYAARPVGSWVLAIGGMRYAYVAGMWLVPWLRGTLPPRYWRKVVAATQGVALAFAVANVLPGSLLSVALAGALLLLVESFGRDVAWLWLRRAGTVPTLPAAVPTLVPAVSTRAATVPVLVLTAPIPSPIPRPALVAVGA